MVIKRGSIFKMVRVIPLSTYLCLSRMRDVLYTDKKKTRGDIDFAVRTLCSMGWDKELLAWILLLLSQTTFTGRYALSFNRRVRRLLKKRETDEVIDLFDGVTLENVLDRLYPELTESDEFLTEEQRAELRSRVEGEHRAMVRSFDEQLKRPNTAFVCQTYNENFECVRPSVVVDESVYSECYTQACLEANRIASPYAERFYFIERDEMGLPHTYTIDRLKLVKKLAKGEPLKGVALQTETRESLKTTLAKEIGLYKTYLSMK